MPSIPEGYRKRLAEKEMDEALGSFGAVCISGPAGSGKAWAGLSRSESAFMLQGCNGCGTLNRELADMNVRAAMDGDSPHMIGEWQEVPKLWDSVRSEIDRSRAKGRFILTESYVPRDNSSVHSGTGRIRKIRMAPMSLYESGESTGVVSLGALMRGEDIGIARQEPDMGHLADLVLGGGWPAGLGRSHEERAVSAREHLDSVVADACRMDGMHRKERTFRQVLRLLAENECAVISDARLQ